MDDLRSEINLRHFQSRSKRSNEWNNHIRSQTQQKNYTANEQFFPSQIDDIRFMNVGMPRYLQTRDKMVTRRINQNIMGERA